LIDKEKIGMAQFVTAKEAVTHIKSGDRVMLAHSVGEPPTLVRAMVENYQAYENVEVMHMLALGPCEYCKPEYAGHFRHKSLFAGPAARNAIDEARADYVPNFFSEAPRLLKEGYLPVDVALITVSPPDKHGYCTYGVSTDYTKPLAESAKLVIAQVNKNMPRTFGDTLIHINDIDFAVEADDPLYGMAPVAIKELEQKIGDYCASLVPDGGCLQLGIGGIPNAVLAALDDKNDLGIHSEMFSDGALKLIKNGNINNLKKKIHVGKSAVTFLNGTKELYDYADDNPSVEFYTVDYINNPTVIGQNDKVVSINGGLSVDLQGQLIAHNLNKDHIISGAGGFVDFVRGSSFSKGGIAICAMPSTGARGKISRIEMEFDVGRPITLSYFESHYIVTEYGIANMRGADLRQRARQLIGIAHPDFRDELKEYYEKKFREKYPRD
jgi:4-hydroxybutyrate CoA-transferase